MQFMCTQTKKCIPQGWTCDGEPDCGGDDHSDEDVLTTCKAFWILKQNCSLHWPVTLKVVFLKVVFLSWPVSLKSIV